MTVVILKVFTGRYLTKFILTGIVMNPQLAQEASFDRKRHIIGAIFGQPDFSHIMLGPIAIGNFINDDYKEMK